MSEATQRRPESEAERIARHKREHSQAANVRQANEYLQPGESGLEDDPFTMKGKNQFVPPVCNKCGKPAPTGQTLNRYSTCKACEEIMIRNNKARQQRR